MLRPDHPTGLVRSAGARLLATPDLTVFAENDPAAVSAHAHPAWKVVLCVDGLAEVALPGRSPVHAPGVIVAPQVSHTCATSGPYVAVFVEAWRSGLRPEPRVGRLNRTAVRRLLDAAHLGSGLGEPADLAELDTALDPVIGPAPTLDPRVDQVVRRLAGAASIEGLATDAGLSAAWLRSLMRSTVGIPLARLRQWARLRAAVAALGVASLADAAHVAGFTDQAHMTRFARRLLGRTPGSLKVAVGGEAR